MALSEVVVLSELSAFLLLFRPVFQIFPFFQNFHLFSAHLELLDVTNLAICAIGAELAAVKTF